MILWKVGFVTLANKRGKISLLSSASLPPPPPFNLFIGKYVSVIKSGRNIFSILPKSTLADYSGTYVDTLGLCHRKSFTLSGYFFSSSLLQFCRGGSSACLCRSLFLSYSYSSLPPPAAVFAHFPKCFLATKPSPEQAPNFPTTHHHVDDDDDDDD